MAGNNLSLCPKKLDHYIMIFWLEIIQDRQLITKKQVFFVR